MTEVEELKLVLALLQRQYDSLLRTHTHYLAAAGMVSRKPTNEALH